MHLKRYVSSLNFSELLKNIFIPKHVTTYSCIKVPKHVFKTTRTWLETRTPQHHQCPLFLSVLREEVCSLLALRSKVLYEMFDLPTIIIFDSWVAILSKMTVLSTFEAFKSWVAWLTSVASTFTTSSSVQHIQICFIFYQHCSQCSKLGNHLFFNILWFLVPIFEHIPYFLGTKESLHL